MNKALYTKIIAQLLTDISMTSDPDEKNRLTVLCGQVIESSGLTGSKA
mgnify:FL=1